MSYQKILIALDNSEHSMRAAEKGLELAHLLNAQVGLVFVVDISKVLGSIDTGVVSAELVPILKIEAKQTLDQLAAKHNEKGMMKFTPEGRPAEAILETAKSWEADLIVMGTHGRTGLMHLLLGSIAEYVVRHSKIPVMVVPAKHSSSG